MQDITVEVYERDIAPTDRLSSSDVRIILKGLFGEVGSLITVSKKHDREGDVFEAYQRSLREEIGDIFWYIAAICRRKTYGLDDVISSACDSAPTQSKSVPPRNAGAIISQQFELADVSGLEEQFFELAQIVAELLPADLSDEAFREKFVLFVASYLKVVQSAELSFQEILSENLAKARGRFIEPDITTLPVFDSQFGEDESLPEEFRIEVMQKANGKSYLKWRGVFIGDPLTDNIAEGDGYRFHDVFHFAHAAILHWSPVFRALIKHKRKSDPRTDEHQDSGRAIVIEEGIAAYIFSYAKRLNFFEGQNQVSFDLLKTVNNFVRGYEVEECPLYLWEQAILQGYDVFREVQKKKKGVIVGNLRERSLKFEPLK